MEEITKDRSFLRARERQASLLSSGVEGDALTHASVESRRVFKLVAFA